VGNLWISGNTGLTTIAALDNLSSLGGDIVISSTDVLTSLSGLENVTSVGKDLWITDNAALTSLTGLDNVTSIAERALIVDNPALINLTGLDNLTSIGQFLWIGNNHYLLSLTGLDNLTSIGEWLDISNNDTLLDLTALQNLTSIAGDLWITDNLALTSLTGLDNIDPNSIINLNIKHNISLSVCEVKSVCDYLASPGGIITIDTNAIGCNTQLEVETACATVSVENTNYDEKIEIFPNPATNTLSISNNSRYIVREIIIYDLCGQKVLQVKPLNDVIDVSKLQHGMYIIEVISKDSRIREKILMVND